MATQKTDDGIITLTGDDAKQFADALTKVAAKPTFDENITKLSDLYESIKDILHVHPQPGSIKHGELFDKLQAMRDLAATGLQLAFPPTDDKVEVHFKMFTVLGRQVVVERHSNDDDGNIIEFVTHAPGMRLALKMGFDIDEERDSVFNELNEEKVAAFLKEATKGLI